MSGASNQRAFFKAKLQERDRIMSTPKKQKLNVVETNTSEIKAQIKDNFFIRFIGIINNTILIQYSVK